MERARAVYYIVASATGVSACIASPAGEAEPRTSDVDDAPAFQSVPAPERPPGMVSSVRDAVALARQERVDDRSSSLVTSTAEAADGSRYVAGVFSGTFVIGATLLKSRGGDDIFIAQLRPNGAVVWARSVGSKLDESDPRVTFSDDRVKLVAMTDGAVDCGQGPLNTWSSETFFVCTFDADGTPLNGASFPTGRR